MNSDLSFEIQRQNKGGNDGELDSKCLVMYIFRCNFELASCRKTGI